MNNQQTLYSGRRVRGPVPAFQCEIREYHRDTEMEDLGIEVEEEGRWVPGMILLNAVVLALATDEGGEPATKVYLNEDNPVVIRASWEEFWEVYSEHARPQGT